jgi:hypothetical protein
MSEFNPDREIQRIVFDFQEKPIIVKCLKDHSSINIGSNVIKIIKGSEIEVPIWVAQKLAEKELVSIENMKRFDIPYMQTLLWDERKSQTPIEMDPDFFPIVSLQIDELDKKGTTFALRDKERMEALMKDIITKRRFKIMKLAQKTGDPSPFIKHLTPEELWLFQTLREQMNQWEQSLVSNGNNKVEF